MQKIRIDFDNPGLPQHISAVENDSQSRFFQATLYENGKAYTAPEGAAYSIMYRGFGPQNQGWYDTINDGAGKRAACAVSGNVVTCEIARQALQVPSHVSIVLCVTTGNGYMLKSWPIECDCKNDRYDSTVEIQSFFYVTNVSNASWMQAIQAVEDLKNTIDPTLSLSGKAADAKATGDAVGQLKEDVDKQMGGYIREVATAGAGILENWNFTYHINLLKGKNIRFLMSGYEGDGFKRTRLLGYDSENTPTAFNNGIHLGDDITFTADKNYEKFFVQIVSSEKQSGNKCDFTIIADADGLGAQLFDIKNESVSKSGDSEVRINNTQFFKTINLFDLSEGVDEKTVLNTQNPVPNDNYFVSKKLKNFKTGKTYIAKNFNKTAAIWQLFVTAWKNDGTFINVQNVGTVSGFVKTFIVPSQADYIKISTANKNKESIMIVEGTVEPHAYVPYTAAEATSYISLPQEGFVHVYHVEKDGSGDFNKLIDAIEYAEKWMDSVVYIGDGTWDLLSELGSEYVESASNSKRGIYLKNRIHLIGSSRSLITAHYNGDNQQTKTWLAPFNSGEYGFTLENITLESSSLRYSVHDERDTSAEPYTNKYINCNFKTDNSNGGLRQCIGGGLGRDGHIFIRGCVFNSVTANHNSAVSYHNTWYRGGTGKSFIDIQNSIVKGTGTFRFSWFGDSTEMTQVICANNSVGSEIQFVQETTDTSLGVKTDIVNMELHQWNNEVRN
jgi:hypothetical protein